MWGLITNAVVMGLIFSVIVILVHNVLLYYLAKLFDLRDQSYKTSLFVSIFLGILTFVFSTMFIFIEMKPLMSEIIGILLYLGLLYFLLKLFYHEKLKIRLAVMLILTLFAFLLTFLVSAMVTYVFNNLSFF